VDPAQVLADIDTAVWLPAEEREPILLREIELKRIAAAHAEKNDYAWQQLVQLQKSLALYYLSQKQDVKAEGVLDKLGEDERKDGEVFMARVELAARSHRLEALLAGYREDSTKDSRAVDLQGTNLQQLRNSAGTLVSEGDKSDALTIWEFVFEQLQLTHGLMASDYMGLAEARLVTGNTSGAVDVLRRMTLLPGDDAANSGMTHFDEVARLLEEKDHHREAIEFLAVLAKSVPWNSSYKVRLAKVLLKIGNDKSQAPAMLSAVAADSGQSYELRVQAALAMRGNSGDAMKLGSDELRLLASGQIAAEQAQRPYFTAARIAAADSLSDGAQRTELLRQAIAISPAGLAGVDGFTGDELRLKIFRAEAAAGHDATALAAVGPLLAKAGAYSGVTADVYAAESDEPAVNDDADLTESIDEFNTAMRPVSADTRLAELERLARLPERKLQSDAEKATLAVVIAQIYEHTEQAASALPYLRLAAYLQKEPRAHTELEQRIAVLDVAFKLEEQNTSRRPKIQRALNQNGVVRPRLAAADLTGVPARKEAQ
jgi:hypothetical protein